MAAPASGRLPATLHGCGQYLRGRVPGVQEQMPQLLRVLLRLSRVYRDGGGAPAPQPTRAKGADPDVLAKRAALKAKLERKKQLAAEQRPKVAAKAKPAAAKAKPKDVDDWESW